MDVRVGNTDAEAEASIFWVPDVESWLLEKDPDAGKDWRWEKKGTTEDEMVGWHHWLTDMSLSKLQEGSLVCFSSWSGKELDMTERLNWTDSSHLLLLRDSGEDLVNGHTLPGRRGSSLWSRGESSACLPALPGVEKTFILLASGANLLEWVRPTHSTS